ncbi:hypothetical protein AD998_12690 [bacterium 336/3]|nr:hypothetical protein AD998_12690 [bacterium 336/3]
MKILIFICICSFPFISLFGQKKAEAEIEAQILFEKAVLLHTLPEELALTQGKDSISFQYAKELENDIYEEALDLYKTFIEKYPKSKLIYRALYNKGSLERYLKMNWEANNTFQVLLNSKANDQEKGGKGSGIMAEPYANYKHEAAKELTLIAIEYKSYEEALKYLDLMKKYPYHHFCGNEYATDEIYTQGLYAQCYIGLNENQKAIQVLLPSLLENGLADNSALVQTLYDILIKLYSKDSLKAQYEYAFKNYQSKTIKRKKNSYDILFIKFLDTEIELPVDSFYQKKESLDKRINHIYTDSLFYKLLSQ